VAALALAVLGSTPAAAQRVGTDVFAYLGFSRATFTQLEGGRDLASWVNGATGGVGIRVPLGGPMGLRTELLLARRGGAFILPFTPEEDATVFLDLVYLEVPVQLQFQSYQLGRQVRPFGFAGVVPSFRLGCDAEARAPSIGVARTTCSEALTEKTEWFEVGATVGVGIELRRGRTLAQLQARYYQGFSDLAPDLPFANRTFAIMLGVGM
jgi:hypothetical protein